MPCRFSNKSNITLKKQSQFLKGEDAPADHGFMCEQRGSFNHKASTLGWQLLMNELKE